MSPRRQKRDIKRRFFASPAVLFIVLVTVFWGSPLPPDYPSCAHAKGSIELVSHLEIPNSTYNTDVWGWVDPITLKEYALVGNNATGLHIVDVSHPTDPTIVSSIGVIPSFDIKTWQNYVCTVDGNHNPV
ncbi:MAG: hypothetical protein JSW58_04400 [Candidatus Latescibacterota bacterium]|nr:MAG: hypothetical protein JSW58_04400 [Candidatus Latescibacterota bacterium]